VADWVRLQAYLRQSAGQRYEAVPVPPFTLFFHPTDDLTYFNYAIPDVPPDGDLREPLDRLRTAFVARGRVPRFEVLLEFAPALGAALDAAGFAQEARQLFLTCTRQTRRHAPEIPGLSIERVERGADIARVRTFMETQRRGFDPHDTTPLPAAEVGRALDRWEGEIGFLALLDGQPAGAGMLMAPLDGIAELTGIATLVPFRRRGIATALTAHAVQAAFARGVEAVCLSAEDERAGRVYTRVGFVPAGTMLAYRSHG
jgi:ribosomal protein S18 acetylase RimI-like enzyme